MDKNVQPHLYSPSSSHELPMEPRAKVVPRSGGHSIFSHFPKDRNCDIYLRTKITRTSCRRRTGTVVPRAENLVIYDPRITKFSVKDVNHEMIIDTLLWCKIWQRSGYNLIHAKQKLHKKPSAACKSSWSPRGNQKSFTLTIPWNSAKLVKISPGIIACRHHTDRKQMGLLKEQCAE